MSLFPQKKHTFFPQKAYALFQKSMRPCFLKDACFFSRKRAVLFHNRDNWIVIRIGLFEGLNLFRQVGDVVVLFKPVYYLFRLNNLRPFTGSRLASGLQRHEMAHVVCNAFLERRHFYFAGFLIAILR